MIGSAQIVLEATFADGVDGEAVEAAAEEPAMTVLYRDAPELELVDDAPAWRDTFTARSLHRMPVRWA